MNKTEDVFSYTYSAENQEEIKSIRKKYLPPEENKLERLRRLDESAAGKARTWGIAAGVIGALIMGTGMSIAMTELGHLFGSSAMIAGIVIGIPGMALVSAAYPIYMRVLKKERERIAPEIIRLADELLK